MGVAYVVSKCLSIEIHLTVSWTNFCFDGIIYYTSAHNPGSDSFQFCVKGRDIAMLIKLHHCNGTGKTGCLGHHHSVKKKSIWTSSSCRSLMISGLRVSTGGLKCLICSKCILTIYSAHYVKYKKKLKKFCKHRSNRKRERVIRQ